MGVLSGGERICVVFLKGGGVCEGVPGAVCVCVSAGAECR